MFCDSVVALMAFADFTDACEIGLNGVIGIDQILPHIADLQKALAPEYRIDLLSTTFRRVASQVSLVAGALLEVEVRVAGSRGHLIAAPVSALRKLPLRALPKDCPIQITFRPAREWRNGRCAGLRIQCRKAWGFKSPLSHCFDASCFYCVLNIRERLLPKSLTISCVPISDNPNGKSSVCALGEVLPAFLSPSVKSA